MRRHLLTLAVAVCSVASLIAQQPVFDAAVLRPNRSGDEGTSARHCQRHHEQR